MWNYCCYVIILEYMVLNELVLKIIWIEIVYFAYCGLVVLFANHFADNVFHFFFGSSIMHNVRVST